MTISRHWPTRSAPDGLDAPGSSPWKVQSAILRTTNCKDGRMCSHRLPHVSCLLLVPTSAASRASVKANNAWMQTHWQDYRGQWVAVREGQLVYATSSF